jgi:flagellin-like protein
MMNFRKLKKSTKALSPVVASIILIAVTVAVSIAVAAWMGALTTGFMATEQLSITNAQFVNGNANMTLTVSNTGTTSVTIQQVQVNGAAPVAVSYYNSAGIMLTAKTIPGNAQGATIMINNAASPNGWVSGNAYTFKLVSAKGTAFTYTATAP